RPLDRDTAVERTIEGLKLAKILRPDDRIELVHTEEISPAYIIFDLDHARNVGIIRDWLRSHGIWNIGRFGEWQYFNMDHSMRSGKTAAMEILRARGVQSERQAASRSPCRGPCRHHRRLLRPRPPSWT